MSHSESDLHNPDEPINVANTSIGWSPLFRHLPCNERIPYESSRCNEPGMKSGSDIGT